MTVVIIGNSFPPTERCDSISIHYDVLLGILLRFPSPNACSLRTALWQSVFPSISLTEIDTPPKKDPLLVYLCL